MAQVLGIVAQGVDKEVGIVGDMTDCIGVVGCMPAVVRLLVWVGSPSTLEGLHSVALRVVGDEVGERRMSPVGAGMTLFRHLVVLAEPMCCLFGDGACARKFSRLGRHACLGTGLLAPVVSHWSRGTVPDNANQHVKLL